MSALFELTVLGTRGSMAASRADCAEFGGDTSCYLLRAGEETVLLDAGSGLTAAPAETPRPPVVLLSHVHLDHIMGLGMFRGFDLPGQQARVYVPFCADGNAAAELLDRVFSPPVWPLRLGQFKGKPELLPLPERLRIGGLLVECAEGNHPDGAMILRLRFEGRSIVYATDYEHAEPSFSRLAAFAEGADLLMYDAQFTEEEYPAFRGFGHSTGEKGVELLRRSGAKRLLLIHHAPTSTDAELRRREEALNDPRVSYAREGQVIRL